MIFLYLELDVVHLRGLPAEPNREQNTSRSSNEDAIQLNRKNNLYIKNIKQHRLVSHRQWVNSSGRKNTVW